MNNMFIHQYVLLYNRDDRKLHYSSQSLFSGQYEYITEQLKQFTATDKSGVRQESHSGLKLATFVGTV